MATVEEGNPLNITMSNLSITSENEFFKELYANSGLKNVTVTIFFLGTIFGLLLEFGIIWYEKYGNHRYRTAINQLFSTTSWLVVSYIIFVYIPDGMRYLIGPLEEIFCDVHNFLKNYIFMSIILTLDCIILLRYIFVFRLSNFAIINDDLIARFLQITSLTLGLWMALVRRLSVGKMPLNYYMCCGKNPAGEKDNDDSEGKFFKYDSIVILTSLSFILHTVVFIKIFIFQREAEKITQGIELGRIQNPERENSDRRIAWQDNQPKQPRNVPKSIADLTTQVCCLIITTLSAIIHVVMNQLEPEELNNYGNRWLTYFNQINGVAVAILGISLQYYIKNHSILRVMWRSISTN